MNVRRCNCCGLYDGPFVKINLYDHGFTQWELLCDFCVLLNRTPELINETVKLFYGIMQGPIKERFKLYAMLDKAPSKIRS